MSEILKQQRYSGEHPSLNFHLFIRVCILTFSGIDRLEMLQIQFFLRRNSIFFDISDVCIVFAFAVMWLEYQQYGVKNKQTSIYVIQGKFLVWLFVQGLSSQSTIFLSYGDFTTTVDELQTLTYARHSWPLSSEGSLACHIYFDTGNL